MSVDEFNESGEVVPRFRELLDRHAGSFDLDEGGAQFLNEMLRRGSLEVMAIRNEAERIEAIQEASIRLEAALVSASEDLRSAGYTYVDQRTLSAVMNTLCPVPPFCLGTGGSATEASPRGAGEPATVNEAVVT